jgi:acetyl-CoA carboxylase alpha subunit
MGRQEIGMMRAQLETTKFQIIQWLFGVVTGAGALGLGMSLRYMLLTGSIYSVAQLNGVSSIIYRMCTNSGILPIPTPLRLC